jgi:hypothetical protein
MFECCVGFALLQGLIAIINCFHALVERSCQVMGATSIAAWSIPVDQSSVSASESPEVPIRTAQIELMPQEEESGNPAISLAWHTVVRDAYCSEKKVLNAGTQQPSQRPPPLTTSLRLFLTTVPNNTNNTCCESGHE